MKRTIEQILYRASILRVHVLPSWSDEEIKMLKDNYTQIGPRGCSKIINKSRSKCSDMARKLSLAYYDPRHYSEEEDDIIKKYYPLEGIDCAKRLTNRDPKNIQQRAIKFGLRSPYNYINKWSDDELQILEIYYPIGGKYEVIKHLKTKSMDQIASKANALHLKSPNSKPKRVICVETNKIYESASQAIKETGLGTIDPCVRGKTKTAGGYHWKYVEEENEQ